MSVRVLFLALGNFAVNTGAFLVAGMLADIAARTGVSVSLAGQLITVYAVTYAVSAPLLSGAFGHGDRRRLLLVALGLCAVGNLLTALAPGFATLVAARAVTAVGAALFTPAAVVMAADLAPLHQRGRAVAAVVTGSTLATVIGVPAGLLLSGPLGYPGVYGIVVGLCVLAVVALRALPRTAPMPRVALRSRFAVVADAAVVLVLGVALLASLSDFAVYTFVVPVLSAFPDLGTAAVSALLLAYGVAGVLGNALAGWVTDRFGAWVAMLGSLLLLAAGLFGLPLTGGAVLPAAVALVLWGLGGWGVLPALQARLIDLAPLAASAVVALNVSAIWFGMGLGGLVGGAVIDTAGLGALAPVGGALALAAVPLVAGAAAIRARRRGRAADAVEADADLGGLAASDGGGAEPGAVAEPGERPAEAATSATG